MRIKNFLTRSRVNFFLDFFIQIFLICFKEFYEIWCCPVVLTVHLSGIQKGCNGNPGIT